MQRTLTTQPSRRWHAFATIRELAALLVLFALPMALLWPAVLGPMTVLPVDQYANATRQQADADTRAVRNPLLSDLVLQSHPWRLHVARGIERGEPAPLWNPHAFAGTPFLAKGQHLALYPLSVVFVLCPLAQAFGLFILLHLALASAAAYLLARSFGLGWIEGLVCGMCFGSGALLLTHSVFPALLATAAWMPLVVAAAMQMLAAASAGRKAPLVWWLVGIAAVAMQALAGHIEVLGITLLFASAVVTTLAACGGRRVLVHTLLPLAGMLALGLAAGAPQWIPQVAVLTDSFRAGSVDLAEARELALPLRQLALLLVPDLFGHPAQHGYELLDSGSRVDALQPLSFGVRNYVEGALYVGLLPLLLAPLAWRGQRALASAGHSLPCSATGFALAWLVAGALAFGTPLYSLLLVLPGVDQLRTPYRWMLPATLCLAMLAALGAHALRSGQAGDAWLRRASVVAVVIALLALLAVVLLRLNPQVMLTPLEPLFDRAGRLQAVFPDTLHVASYLYPALLRVALLALASGLLLAAWVRCAPHSPCARLAPLVMLALLATDLLLAGREFHAPQDSARLEQRPALAEFLDRDPGPWRMITYEPVRRGLLEPNIAWSLGLQDARGYDSIISDDFRRYMQHIETQDLLPYNRIAPLRNAAALGSPWLHALNVKYVVSETAIDHSGYDLVFEHRGLRVYRNDQAMPRAYLMPWATTVQHDDPLAMLAAHDPRHQVLVAVPPHPLLDGRPSVAAARAAAVIDYGNDSVVVEARVSERIWLVLADAYDAGWQATAIRLGGVAKDASHRRVDVHQVNGLFRGVVLEPGHWQVRFEYRPLAWSVGRVIGILGVFGILVIAVVSWYRRRDSERRHRG